MSYWAAIAQAAGSIGGAATSYYAQKEANKMNYKMFKEQLEYDKPINQVARLKEAGLNPNLIYGSGIQNSQTAGRQPKFENPMDKALAGLNVGLLRSQLAKANSEAELAKTEAKVASVNAQYVPVMNTFSVLRSIEDLRRGVLNNERMWFDNELLFRGKSPSFDRGVWSQGSRLIMNLWDMLERRLEAGANRTSRPTSKLTGASTPVEGDFLNAMTPAAFTPAGSWYYGSSYH